MKTNVGTLVISLAAVSVLVLRSAGEPWTLMRFSGLAIGAPSLALLMLARMQLGGSFSIDAEAKALVTHGLYSRIRHPVYVFSGLFITGFFLFMQKPPFLLVLVVLIPFQILRAREEETVLAAEFGEQYEQYKGQTWF